MKRYNAPSPVGSRAYLVRPAQGSPVAFVQDPDCPTRWMKVNPCVLFVDCEGCKVKAGVPCKSRHGLAYRNAHCGDRSRKFRLPRRSKAVYVVVDEPSVEV